MTDALIETDVSTELARTSRPSPPPGQGGRRPPAADRVGASSFVRDRLERGMAWAGGHSAAGYVSVGVMVVCVVFVFWQLQPRHLLSATIPTGGDMAAHVWGPAYLRDHLLPKGRLSGWSPDWYAGYPAFHFYMVVPFLVIALLSYVIPYGVAFKLVAVSGTVAFPFACWFFGRINKLPFPVPPLLAVGGTLFLFDRSFSIYGGNIASMLAGEFCFSISLTLAVLYLGVLGAGLRTGRYRGWAALLLGLTGLCHVIPFLFALAGTLIWLVVWPRRSSLRYLATAGPVGLLLLAFWMIPFYGRSGYMNDMGWVKLTDFTGNLLTRSSADSTLRNIPDIRPLFVFAALGLGLAVVMRLRAALYFGATAAASAVAFILLGRVTVPIIGDRLWNARVLPFYYLSIYLLAAVGVGLALTQLGRLIAADGRRRPLPIVTAVMAGLLLVVLVYLAAPMRSIPGGRVDADGIYRWGLGPLQVTQTDVSFLPDWVTWNFAGLESWERPAVPGSSEPGPPTYDRAYPELYALVSTMKQIGTEHGCGRAMWEYEEQHNRYGSPMEPMLLPFFTDSCIGSMEGLYFEASATTPYHFINSTELSKFGSGAQSDLPYPQFPEPSQADFDKGVAHLQLLGVRYYLAIDDFTKGRAGANPALSKLADSGPWTIYLVAGSDLVAPLANEPAVLTGQAVTGHPWQDTSTCWYVNPGDWGTVLVDRGPDEWQRVARTVTPDPAESPQQQCGLDQAPGWSWFDSTGAGPEARDLPDIEVTDIVQTDDSISFNVSKPGVPVLVKTSYFPNWQVDGATEIARATPNLMVVVPTGTHVELHYGRTGLDLVAMALTLLGIVALVLLFRARPLTVSPARALPWSGAPWGRRGEASDPPLSPDQVDEPVPPQPHDPPDGGQSRVSRPPPAAHDDPFPGGFT